MTASGRPDPRLWPVRAANFVWPEASRKNSASAFAAAPGPSPEEYHYGSRNPGRAADENARDELGGIGMHGRRSRRYDFGRISA
jgi:hypothetical protein